MDSKELRKAWEESGFVGSRKLYQIVKMKHPDIKFKDIDLFVKGQDTAQLHKVAKKRKPISIFTPFLKY